MPTAAIGPEIMESVADSDESLVARARFRAALSLTDRPGNIAAVLVILLGSGIVSRRGEIKASAPGQTHPVQGEKSVIGGN